ncbi:hypothetical protein ABPG74_010505 [Tetrahymena malaccensis]
MSSKLPYPRIEGKCIHYVSNGSGRDSYIWKVNGGLFKEKLEDPKGFEIGTFNGKRHYKQPNNYLPAKHIHYRTDGTGRDSYINVDEGGLSQYSWNRHNFIRNLRGYNKINYTTGEDFFTKLQFSRPQSGQVNNRQLMDSQMRTTQRLSQPKVREDPYKHARVQSAHPGLRTLYG